MIVFYRLLGFSRIENGGGGLVVGGNDGVSLCTRRTSLWRSPDGNSFWTGTGDQSQSRQLDEEGSQDYASFQQGYGRL